MKDILAGLTVYAGYTLGFGAFLLGVAHGPWWLAVGGLGVTALLAWFMSHKKAKT